MRKSERQLTVADIRVTAAEGESTFDLKARLWWITMIRAVAALGLGIGLLVLPAMLR